MFTQCLKIAQKVTFNITSEANYVYILSGQKFIKNAKNNQFSGFSKNWKCNILSYIQTLCVQCKSSNQEKKLFFDKLQSVPLHLWWNEIKSCKKSVILAPAPKYCTPTSLKRQRNYCM